MKTAFKPGTLLYPLPAVMVTCGDAPENWNIITVAWTGTLCSDPPMCYVSIRPERHSHSLISRTGEFVINLTTTELARQTDWCGVRSGRDYNKFREMGLHPETAQLVKAPLIKESPLAIECRVREVRPLGTHDMFMADVVAIDAEVSAEPCRPLGLFARQVLLPRRADWGLRILGQEKETSQVIPYNRQS